jgi:hypothetical protein
VTAAGAVLFLAVAAASPAPKPYSLDDLRALAGRAAWVELAAHLDDVPPAQRDADWEKLAARTAVGLMESPETADHAGALFDRFPQVKASLAGDATSADEAFRVGKLARARMKPWFAIPFFRSALAKGTTPERCADADLRLAVLSAIGLADDGPGSASAGAIRDAQAILRTDCLATLKTPVLEALRTGSPAVRKNACPVLKDKNALGKIDRKSCGLQESGVDRTVP